MQHTPVSSLGLLKQKVQAAHLTREEVIAALLSPSIKWMGDSTKWVMRKSLHSQKFAQLLRSCQLKSTHCPCLPRCARLPFFLLQQIVDNNYNQKIAAGFAATGLHAKKAMLISIHEAFPVPLDCLD